MALRLSHANPSLEFEAECGQWVLSRPGSLFLAVKPLKALHVEEGLLEVICEEAWCTKDVGFDKDGHHSNRERQLANERVYVQERLLNDQSLQRGQDLRQEFALCMPAVAPPSYQGELCRIQWKIRLTIRRRFGHKETQDFPIIVLQPANGHFPVLQASTTSNFPETCVLRLVLDAPKVLSGRTVTGVLSIEPQKSFNAAGVRVELLRHERVAGKQGSVQHHIEDRILLAGPEVFNIHVGREYPFTLQVPEAVKPSYHTPRTSAYWEISALISRQRRPEIRISAQVDVYSAPGP